MYNKGKKTHNLKHFILFLGNAQAIYEMPRGKFQAMHVLPTKKIGFTCIAYSFSPLHEIPDIFRHFMKCLTSGFACNIYITVSKFVDYYSRWHIIAKNTFSRICCCRHKQTCIKRIYVCTACIWCATLYSLHLPVVPSAV